MFNFYRRIYLNQIATTNESWLAGISPIIMISLWIITSVGIGKNLAPEYERNLFNELMVISLPALSVVYLLIHGLDKLIDVHVSFITNKKKSIKHFIASRLFKPVEFNPGLNLYSVKRVNEDCSFNQSLNYLQFTVPTFMIFYVCYITLVFPPIIFVVGFVAVWFAGVWIARKIFMTSEHLIEHMGDPDAHEKLKSE